MDYKQASITIVTANKIDELKKKFAERGTPKSAPVIIGEAINEYAKKV